MIHFRCMALYAPSLVLIVWTVLWSMGVRSASLDVVLLVTLALAAAAHTYAEIKTRRRHH